VSSDSGNPPRKKTPAPGRAVALPPQRSRAFTIPDDGAVEEARQLSISMGSSKPEALMAHPTPQARPAQPVVARPAAPVAPTPAPAPTAGPKVHYSASALELADAREPELEFDIDLSDAGGSEPPDRPTEPAPPNYEASAQRAVDGTIPIDGSLLAPPIPAEARIPVPAPRPEVNFAEDMSDLVALGDYSGALEIADRRLEQNPGDEDALQVRDQCRAVLIQMYSARLGSLDRIPVIIVPQEQLRWMSIDQRAAFMLHHIDGVSTLEMILDVSGMPLLEAMRILTELLQQRVVTFR
jgi:hypothetical protein